MSNLASRAWRASHILFIQAVFAILPCCFGSQGQTAASDQPPAILLENVRIFDGVRNGLSQPTNVLVRGNKIISNTAGPATPPPSGMVIHGGGRTLMPGLIDAHAHIMMEAISVSALMAADIGYVNLIAADAAQKDLMRGFTSLRDMAGPAFGLKRAIDSNLVPGPRIWPSGAMISQTSGHGDYRNQNELPRAPGSPLTNPEVQGFGIVADGADQVLIRTRENLMRGASQIKLAAGGGVSSAYDPLDVTQYSEGEIHAAVEAAGNWGTYVTVHAYTPKAIQTAISAGVKCIEHGQLMDESTAKIIAEKGIWLSAQPFLDDEDAVPFPAGSLNRAKQLQMSSGTDTEYQLAKKYKLKTAWGTDTLFDPKLVSRRAYQLTKMVRWYTPFEVLHMATSVNGELLALSGPRTPYPGKLGVIEPGALADLLLVDGNPLENIKVLEDSEKNLLLIMKDGKIFKNILH